MQVDLKGHKDPLDRRYSESYRRKWLHSRAIYRKVTLATRYAVLNALVDFGNNKHPYVWPSLQTLHKVTRYSIKTVSRSLSDLEEAGVIIRIPEDMHNYPSTMYRINYDLMDKADYQKLITDLQQAWEKDGYDILSNIPPIKEGGKNGVFECFGR